MAANKHRGQSIDDFMAGQFRRHLARCFAFGMGAATAILIIGEAINIGLAISARKLEGL